MPSPTTLPLVILATILSASAFLSGCGTERSGSPPFPGTKPIQRGEVDYRGAKIPVYEIYSMPVEMKAQAVYPDFERRKGIKGEATLVIVIDQYGGPVDFRVIKSTPTPDFGRAAADAAAKWHYFAFKDASGHPIVHALRVNVMFEPPQ